MKLNSVLCSFLASGWGRPASKPENGSHHDLHSVLRTSSSFGSYPVTVCALSAVPERKVESTEIQSLLLADTQVASPWLCRARELLEYSKEHGHCLVPKRYQESPSLGNWVNKQRVEYRKYVTGETPCSLTAERIELLNEMGFSWDASNASALLIKKWTILSKKDAQDKWWSNLDSLCSYMTDNQIDELHDLPSKSRADDWLREVRHQFSDDQKMPDPAKRLLSKAQLEALYELDPHWNLNPRDARWERRFTELVDYANQHGHCCVPISYENKKLANWVSTQRKQYNLRLQKKKNGLTAERVVRLEAIGFVWNRWEHEFALKQGKL